MSYFKIKAKQIWYNISDNITKEKLDSIYNRSNEIFSKVLTSQYLSKFMYKIKLLLEMIKDYMNGNYKNIPWKVIASIVSALIYLLIPLDAIPDFIFPVGLLDDAFIIGLCIKSFDEDIEKYRIWKYGIDKNTEKYNDEFNIIDD